MILVFSLPVVLGVVGAAIDFSGRLSANLQLQDAVDAASVGSVATGSVAFTTAATMQTDGEIVAGETNAVNIFTKNANGIAGITNLSSVATVAKSAGYVKSTVQATASYPTTFMGLFGISTMRLSATSSSINGMPPYLDFYLLLDVSGSMGVPSTVAGETALAKVNTDDHSSYPTGCTFACHEPGYVGYTVARTNNIQLRLDAVSFAVQSLIQTAQSTQKYDKQFRIGLYPFIVTSTEYFKVTDLMSAANITALNTAAGNIPALLDTGSNPALGSGGTHMDIALAGYPSSSSPTLNAPNYTTGLLHGVSGVITTNGIGNGTNVNSRQPWIFLVTDGSQDNQYYWAGSWTGSNHATTIDANVCAKLKASNIKIAVLYIPYATIPNPNPSFASDEDDYANNNIASIPAPLKTCASSGFFFTANTPADITTAMNTMFNQAVATDHLTQ